MRRFPGLEFVRNLKITTKVFVGFSIVLGLLITVGTLSSLSLGRGSTDFTHYRATALQTNQAGRIQANLLEARLSVKNFIISGTEETIADVKARADKTLAFNDELGGMVTTADRAAVVNAADAELRRYLDAFDQVTKLQAVRNDRAHAVRGDVGSACF